MQQDRDVKRLAIDLNGTRVDLTAELRAGPSQERGQREAAIGTITDELRYLDEDAPCPGLTRLDRAGL